MSVTDQDALFERVYRIVSQPRFLALQGLGNEVPFFIQPYDVQQQVDVYRRIEQLRRRLAADGNEPLLISLYDVVLERFSTRGQLEKLFERESSLDKQKLKSRMQGMLSPEKEIAPAVRNLMAASAARLVFLYEVGEVFPYLRTHSVLNNLHSVVERVPLVVFFPGSYVSSDRDGFYLSLFGRFKSDYYRAFHLEDYIERGKIDVDA